MVRYKNDEKDARRVYQAGRHNADNNKFRHTPLYIIAELGTFVLGLYPGNKSKAEMYLTAQYGKASARTSYWWVRFARITPSELLPTYRSMPWLNPNYVLKNNFFVGTEASASQRLSLDFAQAALAYLKDEREDSDDKELHFKIEDFVSVCKAFKVLELFGKGTLKEFGAVARDPFARQRSFSIYTLRGGTRSR